MPKVESPANTQDAVRRPLPEQPALPDEEKRTSGTNKESVQIEIDLGMKQTSCTCGTAQL